jgi:hypothetical protein
MRALVSANEGKGVQLRVRVRAGEGAGGRGAGGRGAGRCSAGEAQAGEGA